MYLLFLYRKYKSKKFSHTGVYHYQLTPSCVVLHIIVTSNDYDEFVLFVGVSWYSAPSLSLSLFHCHMSDFDLFRKLVLVNFIACSE